jgi:RNA polymerase sigma-70 factor (ECF subfamily)
MNTTLAAFVAALARAYAEPLRRHLRLRGAAEEDAAEIVQEAFAQVLRLGDSARIRHPRAFLFRIAANLQIDRQRRAIAAPLVDGVDTLAAVSDEPTPEENVRFAELELAYHAALAELPEKCRTVFLMRRFDDLGTGEIAAKLGISPRMVQKYLVHALNHFHNRLGVLAEGVRR